MPQDRMAKRLGLDQKTIHNHLGKLAALPNLLNDDLRVTFRLSRGFKQTLALGSGWAARYSEVAVIQTFLPLKNSTPLFHLNRFYDTLRQNANFYGKDPGTGRSYAALRLVPERSGVYKLP